MIEYKAAVQEQSYEGRLGTFTYNPEEFSLRYKYAENGVFEYLWYKGHETDGSRIQIPNGIIDMSYMFEHNRYLMTPPAIPPTVKVAEYAFHDCLMLRQGASLPYGIERIGFMYQDCRAMLAGSTMPDTVVSAQYMYDGCISLYNPGDVSKRLENGSGLYRNCKNMRVQPEIPETIYRKDFMFLGCDWLERKNKRKMY